MRQHWKTYKLSDALEIKYGKDHKKIGDGNIPIYGTGGIMRFGNQSLYDQESILIPRKGSLNNIYYINEPFWTVDTLFWSKINREIVNAKYLYYALKLLDFANMDVGSAIPSLTTSLLNRIEIILPPLTEQRAIASMLSALDDKIELNLQMNKTLEEMAMALYKHWFIDFGPFKDGDFVESELGLIPAGWEVKTIGDVIETIGGGTPKTSEPNYWQNGDIDWYSPTDLTTSNSLYSLGTAKKITSRGLAKSSAKLLPPNTLLMSSRATIGALTITRKEACTNQGFISMIPNDKISVFQLYCWAKANMKLIESKANGSTFKEISKSEFRALLITIGSRHNEYLLKSSELFARIESNLIENQILKPQREHLLPKLISGEVKIKMEHKS
jgi:type I restriction enzyme S subunit